MPESHSLLDFLERFDAFQREARSYGIRSLVVLNDDDPLSKDEAIRVGHLGTYAKDAWPPRPFAEAFLSSRLRCARKVS